MHVAATVIILSIASVPVLAQEDKVVTRGNPPLVFEGTIEAISCKEVEYASTAGGGAKTTVAARDVLSLDFGPNRKGWDFTSAEKAFAAADYSEAREKFERSRRDPQVPEPIKQLARFSIIRCHLDSDDFDGAIASAKAFREEFKMSFYLKDSFLLQYRAVRARGNAAGLKEVTDDFEKAGKERDLFKEWQRLIDLLKAETSELRGELKEAAGLYGRLADDKDAEVSSSAKLGQMRSLAGTQDWSSLQSRADSVLAGKNPSPRLQMGGFLARGKILLISRKKNQEALFELLRCTFVLAPKVTESCPEEEESFAYAAIACARTSVEQKEKEKKDSYRMRALELKQDLVKRYPGSRLISEVDRELAAIPK